MKWLTDGRSRSGSNLWIGVILVALGVLTLRGSVPVVGAVLLVAGAAVIVAAFVQRSRETTAEHRNG